LHNDLLRSFAALVAVLMVGALALMHLEYDYSRREARAFW
jgi:hypothetical protein